MVLGKKQLLATVIAGVFSVSGFAVAGEKKGHEDHGKKEQKEAKHEQHNEHGAESGPACTGFGPQTPRDIDSSAGTNKVAFGAAPSYTDLNLCNIHFHKNAEHKAKDFSIYAGDGHEGFDSGYQCNMSKELSKAELAATAEKICAGEHGELKPGDTIEIHWVHSSADVKPGPTLGSCLSENIKNPALRVEAQVYTLVNDKNALQMSDIGYDGNTVNGRPQAKSIPNNTGTPVVFGGSTTGPKYSESTCSPLQVTWSVRPQCAKLDINSVGAWCKSNEFKEDHAHGVRKLVVNPALLSEIK